MLIEQFERIPLLGVVTGGQDDTSGGFLTRYGQFGGRSGCQTDVHYIIPHAHQGAANDLLHHRTAQAGITTYHNRIVLRHSCATLRRISCCETNDIHGVQTFAYTPPYSASDTRDAFN